MSAKIRLKRFGSKMRPFYRIVIMDSRQPRNGIALDDLGVYHPIEKVLEKQIRIGADKAREWLAKGATPTDTVKGLLNKQNIHVK